MSPDPAPRARTPFGRALRNIGWLLTGKGIGAALSLVYLGIATRALGVEQFGQFAVILSTAQAIAALVGFQSWQIVVRYGAAIEGKCALGRLVRFCMALDFGAAIAGCAILVAGIALMAPRFGWSPALTGQAMAFGIVLLLSIRSAPLGVLRLKDRYAVAAAAEAMMPIVRFTGAIAAVLAGASVAGFLAAWALSEVLTAAVIWLAAGRALPGMLGGWWGLSRVSGEHPGLWRFAAATNLASTLAAASRQVVVVAVGLFVGPAAAGGYRVAHQLSQALARVTDVVAYGMLPEYAKAHAAGPDGGLQRLFRQAAMLTIGVGAAICILVPIVGRPALRLIAGEAYVGAYPILVLLALAAAFEMMAVAFEPALVGTGRAGQALRIRAVAVAGLLAGAAVLMPRFGALGAAAATLGASALALILFVRLAYRATRPAARQ